MCLGHLTSLELVDFLRVVNDDKARGGVRSKLLTFLRSFDFSHTGEECIRASIFSQKDPDLGLVRELVTGKKACESEEENRALGVMYGMVCGDAIGARVEFEPVDYTNRSLNGMGEGCAGNFCLKPGQWTDDTSMGLCIADSLLVTHGNFDEHDCMHRFLAWWNCGYNNAFRLQEHSKHSVGLGGNISLSLTEYIFEPSKKTVAGDKNTSGNGSVMRNAAVPICFHDDCDKALEVARAQSLITHQGEEAAECCRLLTHVVLSAMKATDSDRVHRVLNGLGDSFKTPLASVQALARSEMEDNNPDRDWRWKTEGTEYHYSPSRTKKDPGYIGSYAMDATAMALHCVWSTDSFSSAILKAANMCGDADTVAAVTGQIAGAFYGVQQLPEEWITTVSKWDGYEIGLRAYRLFHKKWWHESELLDSNAFAASDVETKEEDESKEILNEPHDGASKEKLEEGQHDEGDDKATLPQEEKETAQPNKQ